MPVPSSNYCATNAWIFGQAWPPMNIEHFGRWSSRWFWPRIWLIMLRLSNASPPISSSKKPVRRATWPIPKLCSKRSSMPLISPMQRNPGRFTFNRPRRSWKNSSFRATSRRSIVPMINPHSIENRPTLYSYRLVSLRTSCIRRWVFRVSDHRFDVSFRIVWCVGESRSTRFTRSDLQRLDEHQHEQRYSTLAAWFAIESRNLETNCSTCWAWRDPSDEKTVEAEL